MQISTVYWPLLPCFLRKKPFKRDLTEIYLITFFGDGNFGNTSAMRIIFFFMNVQNLMQILEMQRKTQKKSFVCEIIISELVALSCFYKEGNTCHRQSMW